MATMSEAKAQEIYEGLTVLLGKSLDLINQVEEDVRVGARSGRRLPDIDNADTHIEDRLEGMPWTNEEKLAALQAATEATEKANRATQAVERLTALIPAATNIFGLVARIATGGAVG